MRSPASSLVIASASGVSTSSSTTPASASERPPTEHQTKHVDLQFAVNIRSVVLFYRESIELLRAAGAEHRNALVVNLASLAGKTPQPWLSVYSATKAAVIAYTDAMNKEFNADGVKSVAFCPGLPWTRT